MARQKSRCSPRAGFFVRATARSGICADVGWRLGSKVAGPTGGGRPIRRAWRVDILMPDGEVDPRDALRTCGADDALARDGCRLESVANAERPAFRGGVLNGLNPRGYRRLCLHQAASAPLRWRGAHIQPAGYRFPNHCDSRSVHRNQPRTAIGPIAAPGQSRRVRVCAGMSLDVARRRRSAPARGGRCVARQSGAARHRDWTYSVGHLAVWARSRSNENAP